MVIISNILLATICLYRSLHSFAVTESVSIWFCEVSAFKCSEFTLSRSWAGGRSNPPRECFPPSALLVCVCFMCGMTHDTTGENYPFAPAACCGFRQRKTARTDESCTIECRGPGTTRYAVTPLRSTTATLEGINKKSNQLEASFHRARARSQGRSAHAVLHFDPLPLPC